MKYPLFCVWTVFLLLCCGVPLYATSLTVPGGDSAQTTDAAAQLPPEVRDQFSRRELSSQSAHDLAIRNADLRDRLTKEPDNPALLHELGTVVFQQGGAKEAKALWTVAHKKEPNLASPEVMAAVQEVFRLSAKGDKAEAEKQLASNEKRFTKDPYFQLIKAEQAMRSRNFAVAEKAYEEAHKVGPKLYVTALNLGKYYAFRKRDSAQVNKLYQIAVQLAPEKPEVWQSLGTFQFEQKQADKALESFRKAKALDPDAPMAERRLGDLSFAAGDFSGAEKWYRAALKTTSTPEEEVLVRAALGDVLLRLGQRKEARQEIQEVLTKKEIPPLVFALATIDEVEDKLMQAEKGYRRVLELLPENPLAANNLAMLLLKTDGSAKEALALAERARKAIPDNLIIEGTYGCALVQSGSSAEGVAILEKVTKVNSDFDAWAHYFLVKGLTALNRADEVKAQVDKILAFKKESPTDQTVEKVILRLGLKNP
jgi:tetratricopeptide (TPR) repeat protein